MFFNAYLLLSEERCFTRLAPWIRIKALQSWPTIYRLSVTNEHTFSNSEACFNITGKSWRNVSFVNYMYIDVQIFYHNISMLSVAKVLSTLISKSFGGNLSYWKVIPLLTWTLQIYSTTTQISLIMTFIKYDTVFSNDIYATYLNDEEVKLTTSVSNYRNCLHGKHVLENE